MDRKLILSVLLIISFSLSFLTSKASKCSSDTVVVYFDFGSAKLSKTARAQIRNLSSKYSLKDVDSVSYKGLADSVGSSKANIKLSMKRAKATKKYARYLFRKTATKTSWRGEGKSLNQKKNRKVEIVLFYKIKAEELKEDDSLDSVYVPSESLAPPLCYEVAYDILAKSHTRVISKRRKKYQLIQYYYPFQKAPKKIFYGVKVDGKLTLKKIKWRGGDGYFEALVPLSSFNSYKIFRVTGQPCSACSEPLEEEDKISLVDTTRQVDHLLMKNMQFKRSFLSEKIKQIRVPREFIDSEASYFMGCDMETELIWKEKRGRRKKKFLFLDLKTMNKKEQYYNKRKKRNIYYTRHYFQNIMKVTQRCSAFYMDSKCDIPYVYYRGCGPSWPNSHFSIM